MFGATKCKMVVTAYTDASLCHVNRIAACGYVAYLGGKLIRRNVTFIGHVRSIYLAEATAISCALQDCFLMEGVAEIIIYTDQLFIVNGGNMSLYKAYKELIQVMDIIKEYGVKIELRYVQSHSGNASHDLIDKTCMQQLRKFKIQNDLWKKNKGTKI